jgi:hypothetical protein
MALLYKEKTGAVAEYRGVFQIFFEATYGLAALYLHSQCT